MYGMPNRRGTATGKAGIHPPHLRRISAHPSARVEASHHRPVCPLLLRLQLLHRQQAAALPAAAGLNLIQLLFSVADDLKVIIS